MDKNNSNVPRLSIIVSFNTREMTLECLRSVYRETKTTEFEIIVLDNASSDGSVEAIDSEFGNKIKLIASKTNYGFALGNNIATQEATGSFLLLLNPDTVVLDGAIDKLFEFANNNIQEKIWGGKTIFADGSLNPGSSYSQQTIWSLLLQASGLSSIFRKSSILNPEGIGGWNRDGIRYVDIVEGSFLLITSDLWEKLNGFDEDFFMYGEEADLCLRARAYDANPIATSDATIIHYGGASEKVQSDKVIRLLNAKMLMIYKHFPVRKRKIAGWLLKLWPVSRAWAHWVLYKVGFSTSEKHEEWQEVVNRFDEWSIKDKL